MHTRIAASLLCLAGAVGCSATVGGGDGGAVAVDASGLVDVQVAGDPGLAPVDPGIGAGDVAQDGEQPGGDVGQDIRGRR